MKPEGLGYYIAAKLNANVEDIDFDPDDFKARINSDLIGKFVNIAARSSRFISDRFDSRLAEVKRTQWLGDLPSREDILRSMRAHYQNRQFCKAVRDTMTIAAKLNL